MRKNNLGRGIRVEVKDGNFNLALKKLKRKVDDSGVLIEVVKRKSFEKPTTERKRKKSAAKARWQKQLREQQLPKKLF
jgi:small subunit ribosomal protein S21